MKSPNVAEVLVTTLQQAGARHCYGIVGDTLNPFTDALRRSDIRWIHMRHEEAGAMAAGAEALLSDRLTLCAGTCGPGSLHFVNGIFEAHRNRAPVVLIATQVATQQMGMDFPQEVDLKPIYETCSVFCQYIHHPDQARRLAAMAAQAALNERGVAVLIVPGDLLTRPVQSTLDYRPHHPAPVMQPSDAELDRLAEYLNASQNITLYCGAGCEDARDEILALAECLQAPVAHSARAKDFVEPDNPFNVGMTGMLGIESGHKAVMHCDTLLLLGTDFAFTQFYPEKAVILQVDHDARRLGRRHPIHFGALGQVKATLQALLPRLQKRPQGGQFLLHAQMTHRQASYKWSQRERPGHQGLIHPPHLARMIDLHAAEDAIIVADGGSPMVWMLRHVRALRGRRTLSSMLHGTMANALPSSLGAKVAFPDRQVISFCGDGGLSMLLGELLTCIQEDIAVKAVVFNNSSLGFVEMEQKVEGLLPTYTDLRNPDFAAVARVIGLGAWRVDHGDQLESAILKWLAHPGPALLDVVVNRDELVMPPVVTASEVMHTALYGAKALLAARDEEVFGLLTHNLGRG